MADPPTATSGWATGKYGSALSFDGTDDYVDAGSVSSNARTVSFWLKRGDTSNKDVIDLGTPEIKISSNAITSTGLTSPTYYVDGIAGVTSVANANQWYHITITDTANISASNVDIGKASSNYFLGLIDDVRVYNYARTPDEIRLDYNAGFAAHFGPSSSCDDDPGACMDYGLVGNWGMDEGSGTTAYDKSDYANNGTLTNGPKWAVGKSAGGLQFDGVNDYVNAGNGASLDITDAITVEAWIYTKASQNSFIVAKGYHSADNVGAYFLKNEYLYTYFAFNNAAGGASPSTPGFTSQLNRWYHVVGTYDSINLKLYIDGSLVGQTASTAQIKTTTHPVTVGSWVGGDYSFNGLIDDVRIYNRALTASEIRYHYNRGGPVAEWKFDEGSGTSAKDATENNNDGTLTNMADPPTSTSGWATGKYGTALAFDGSNDYVSRAYDSDFNFGTGSFTLSAWFKHPTISAADYLLARYDSDQGFKVWMDDSGDMCFGIDDDATWGPDDSACTSGIDYDDNSWHHLTAYKDGTSAIYLYIDGTQVASDNALAATATLTSDSASLYIGSDAPTVGSYWEGFVDDVRIYNYARTPDEIRLDYNAGFAAHFGPSSSCDDDPGACMDYGLVGNWGMDEGSGTTAYDKSDYANNGTLTNGPKWAAGKSAGGLQFDGVDDYVLVTDSVSLKPSLITIETWVNVTSFPGGINNIVVKEDYGAKLGYRLFVYNSGNVSLNASDGVTRYECSGAATAITLGSWYHLVATSDGSKLKVYINGVLKRENTGPAAIVNTTNNLNIGRYSVGSELLNGLIDEVRIYNRALSASEIRYHYNRGGPVAHWKFDEGTSDTAFDESNNNNDGTISGATWVSGQYNSALSFDGGNDYVTRADDSDFDFAAADAFSIGAWFKHDTISAADYIFTKSQAGTNAGYKIYMDLDGDIAFAIDDDSTWNPDDVVGDDQSKNYDDNSWHYLTAVKNGTTGIYIYVDGILIDSDTSIAATGTLANDDPIYIGIDDDGVSNAWLGSIDEVRIYNYARSAEQILQDYNAGLSTHFK